MQWIENLAVGGEKSPMLKGIFACAIELEYLWKERCYAVANFRAAEN
jgi:hypothetical protein